ncbi:hypothetical protein JTE90_007143 [Oedothorax gibbosus]|uniref:Uncharacterized protein n=1 Tax=Oedothorax gibbosus TaxID=931172 RepID=A0AAV6VSQ2_9ARAC|nr:hypothetical protein JTE90_007143 [Oedothorax gibbosus]
MPNNKLQTIALIVLLHNSIINYQLSTAYIVSKHKYPQPSSQELYHKTLQSGYVDLNNDFDTINALRNEESKRSVADKGFYVHDKPIAFDDEHKRDVESKLPLEVKLENQMKEKDYSMKDEDVDKYKHVSSSRRERKTNLKRNVSSFHDENKLKKDIANHSYKSTNRRSQGLGIQEARDNESLRSGNKKPLSRHRKHHRNMFNKNKGRHETTEIPNSSTYIYKREGELKTTLESTSVTILNPVSNATSLMGALFLTKNNGAMSEGSTNVARYPENTELPQPSTSIYKREEVPSSVSTIQTTDKPVSDPLTTVESEENSTSSEGPTTVESEGNSTSSEGPTTVESEGNSTSSEGPTTVESEGNSTSRVLTEDEHYQINVFKTELNKLIWNYINAQSSLDETKKRAVFSRFLQKLPKIIENHIDEIV